MKSNVMLTIASLLSILFFTFHLADDIARGMEPGKLTSPPAQRRTTVGRLALSRNWHLSRNRVCGLYCRWQRGNA